MIFIFPSTHQPSSASVHTFGDAFGSGTAFLYSTSFLSPPAGPVNSQSVSVRAPFSMAISIGFKWYGIVYGQCNFSREEVGVCLWKRHEGHRLGESSYVIAGSFAAFFLGCWVGGWLGLAIGNLGWGNWSYFS